MLWTFSPQVKPSHRFIDQDKNLCSSVQRIQKTMTPHHLPALRRDLLLKGFPPPTAHFYSAPRIGGTFFTTFLAFLLVNKMSSTHLPRSSPVQGSRETLHATYSGAGVRSLPFPPLCLTTPHWEGEGGTVSPITHQNQEKWKKWLVNLSSLAYMPLFMQQLGKRLSR